MRALLSTLPGGPETLAIAELPDPVPGAGELRVAVRACSVNFPDVLIIEDRYQVRPPRPFAPGTEIAGVVEAVGEGVAGWAAGDRLIAMIGHGGMAEQAIVPAADAQRLPEGRSFAEGASLIMTYGTTWHALVDRGGLEAGETLLVLGAAGGVGLAGVELGKALGARVIAAVSSEEKAAATRGAGADETIVYPRGPLDKGQSKALADAFKAAAGPDGVDVVYDPVGGDYAEPALRSLGWEGRYLVVGFPAGIPRLPLNLTLLKSCDIRGVFYGAFAARDPARCAANTAALFALWATGRIGPNVTATYPLERAGEAIARMATRDAIGKLVVEIG